MRGREFSSLSLRSLEFRWSKFVELRVKVYLLNEGYTRATTLQEVEILPTLVYSSLFGQKNGSFEFQLDVLRLGEGMYLLLEDWLFA